MSVRVVFFGNQQSVFSSRHFAALLDTEARLVGVVDAPIHKQSTSNPLPVAFENFVRTAQAQGLPCFTPGSAGMSALARELAALKPDLLLAVGYPLILKPQVLAVPRALAANFHASLLPLYRGKHPVFWALRAGERWSGLTVHVMDPGIDTGDILHQVKVRTRKDDSVASLYDRIMDRSTLLVGRLLREVASGQLDFRPQPAGEGSYFSSIAPEDYALDWRWPAEKLRRYVATTPGMCFNELRGRRVYFDNAGTVPLDETHSPGTLLYLGRTRAQIATGQDGFASSRIQINGRSQPLAAFCRQIGLVPYDRVS